MVVTAVVLHISISIALRNYRKDGLDTLRFLHLMIAVYPVQRRVIWAWFHHVSRVFVHKVQISISISLHNYGQDGLDTLRFTTPHDSSLPSRKACRVGVVSSRESCVCA